MTYALVRTIGSIIDNEETEITDKALINCYNNVIHNIVGTWQQEARYYPREEPTEENYRWFSSETEVFRPWTFNNDGTAKLGSNNSDTYYKITIDEALNTLYYVGCKERMKNSLDTDYWPFEKGAVKIELTNKEGNESIFLVEIKSDLRLYFYAEDGWPYYRFKKI